MPDPSDLPFRLKFEAAIQDHVAKKATNKKAKAAARQRAGLLREMAANMERLQAAGDEAPEGVAYE